MKRKNDGDDDGLRHWVVLQASTAGNQSEERQYIIIEDDSTSAEMESVSVDSSCRQSCQKVSLPQNCKPLIFENSKELMKSLCQTFKTKKTVFFCGCYQKPEDPLVSDKEHIQMMAYEIWKVSGYCFQCEHCVILS